MINLLLCVAALYLAFAAFQAFADWKWPSETEADAEKRIWGPKE